MSAQHTPGRVCDACEGFCLRPAEARVDAGLELHLRIGQRVRHRDNEGQCVTGVLRGLSIDGDRGLEAYFVLDAPIVISASEHHREIKIWNQLVPAHEVEPFDWRDELIAEMLAALETARTGLLWYQERNPGQRDGSDDEAMSQVDAAIAKAGSAS